MLKGLTVLLGCQLLGEVLVRASGLPVPGPVVGMVLLFVLLQVRSAGERLTSWVSGTLRASDVLLRHLQLFFVPAGVGVVVYLGVLRDDALPIAVALAGSWLAGLLVVGWSVSLLGRRAGRADGASGG